MTITKTKVSDSTHKEVKKILKNLGLEITSPKLNQFFNTPYFKKYFSSKDSNDKTYFYDISNYLNNIFTLTEVWENIPIDYFQNYLEILEAFDIYSYFRNNEVKSWISTNISPKTFLNMIHNNSNRISFVNTHGTLQDTFNQIEKLISKKIIPTTPKRWRLSEFHDHISYIYLQQTVDNKEHNPNYIPIPYIKERYKIYQPKNTIDLARWGKKVRNCVLSYEDKILNNESIIVFIEEDSIPKYTIELDSNSKEYIVKQSVGIANSSITQEEKELCKKLIILASKKK